ncbi:MAG: pyridoxamine 5'-phosphate oxidase family protein [Caulobacterales bacterium]
MGIRLEGQELDDYLGSALTLILATTRKSGEPFMTPLWFVWKDGSFYTDTIGKSAKVQHIKRDPRVCCMVEDGERWVDLRAVIANCSAEILSDEAVIESYVLAREKKYEKYKRDDSSVPDVTRKHYDQARAYLKLTPRPGEMRSWYNRKIRART